MKTGIPTNPYMETKILMGQSMERLGHIQEWAGTPLAHIDCVAVLGS